MNFHCANIIYLFVCKGNYSKRTINYCNLGINRSIIYLIATSNINSHMSGFYFPEVNPIFFKTINGKKILKGKIIKEGLLLF